MKNKELLPLLTAAGLGGGVGILVGLGIITTIEIFEYFTKKDMNFNLKDILQQVKTQLQDEETKELLQDVASEAGLATKEDLNKLQGFVDNRIGELSEAFVATSIDAHIRNELESNSNEYIGIQNRELVAHSLQEENKTPKLFTDIDFLVVGGKKLVYIEVKTSFQESDLKDFANKLKEINAPKSDKVFFTKYYDYLNNNNGMKFQEIVNFIGRKRNPISRLQKELWFVFLMGNVTLNDEIISVKNDLQRKARIKLRLFKMSQENSDLVEIEVP